MTVTELCAVQLPYLESCRVRKWRKTKKKGDAGYEDSACFMARDVSEKYQSQLHRPLEHRKPAQSL